MAKSLQKHSADTSVIPKINKDQLGKLFVFKDEKARYRKNYIAWDDIERANPPKFPTKKTKHLSKSAKDILAVIMQKLEKDGSVFFNHKYISKVTKCKKRQNINIIEELKHILDISYHNSVTHSSKKYRYSYEFSYKSQKLEDTSVKEVSVAQKIAQQNTPLYIDNKNKNIEDIDLQSNFEKNSEEELQENNTNLETKAKVFHFNQYRTPKSLNEHYPLTQEDCSKLQNLSGRSFNLNAMNEILLDMSKRPLKRLIPPTFKSKKGFLSYMGIAFKKEMRDANKINNETFRIRNNLTLEERRGQEIEKYLTEIEYSLEVSPEQHLKKKLASVLAPIKAYDLLKSYRSITIEEGVAKVKLCKAIDLSPVELEIVLNQIKASHGTYALDKQVYELELIIMKAQSKKRSLNEIKQIPATTWGNIRRRLIAYYGEDIDASWFSKLEATEDNCAKEINLTSSSPFIRDWIKTNYESTIESIAEAMGVRIEIAA